MIKAGDQIFIKPEWQDAGDHKFTFFAVENEDGGRVLMEARGVLEHFNPTQVVRTSMLENN